MGTIDFGEYELDGSQEPYAAKPGEEYKLMIVEVKEGTDKNDLDYIQPRLEIVGEPFAKDFTHFLHLPNKEKMSEKQLNRVKWNMKTFCDCFEIDTSRPMNPADEWPGQAGFAILGVTKSDQYGEQNFIQKCVTPK